MGRQRNQNVDRSTHTVYATYESGAQPMLRKDLRRTGWDSNPRYAFTYTHFPDSGVFRRLLARALRFSLYVDALFRQPARNAPELSAFAYTPRRQRSSVVERVVRWNRLRKMAKVARSIPTRQLDGMELLAVALMVRVEGVR